MARSRNIKPGFFLNEDLAALGMEAQLLFAGLWCIADREGRLEDRPLRIKALVMPYYDVDVDKLLNLLANNPSVGEKFIIRYSIDSYKYIQITKFKSHQNPHKNEAPSVIPAYSEAVPEKHSASTVQEPEINSTNPADSLNSDSLNLVINNNDDHAPAHEEEKQPEPGAIISAFEQEFGRPLSPLEVDRIKDWVAGIDPVLIREALKQAILHGKYNFSYINTILIEWKKNNLRTIQAIQEYNADFEARKKQKGGQPHGTNKKPAADWDEEKFYTTGPETGT